MKKIFTFILLLSVNLFSFALPNKLYLTDKEHCFEIKNHTLYNDDGEFVATIKDNKLYDTEENDVGTLIEDKSTVSLNLFENGKAILSFDFNSETGFMTKAVTYTDGTIDSIVICTYDKEKLTKTTLYNSENIVIGYEEYSYDKKSGHRIKNTAYDENNRLETVTEYDSKTGNMVLESVFDADKHLVLSYEYDSKTAKRIKTTEYNGNGTLKSETIYDKKSEKPTERLIYNEKWKKACKMDFLKVY